MRIASSVGGGPLLTWSLTLMNRVGHVTESAARGYTPHSSRNNERRGDAVLLLLLGRVFCGVLSSSTADMHDRHGF